jgi:hypothetical protein
VERAVTMKRAGVLLLVCALAATAAADEDPLIRARAAAEDLRFEDAARLLDQAWQGGASDPIAVAALAGEISATTGDRAAASRWFSLLVAMDPDAQLPAGTSPKVIALLEDARRALAGARFDVRLRLDRAARRVHVAALDPLGAVAELRAAGARVHARELALPWRPGALAIALLDAHGNVLFRTRRQIAALPAVPAPAPAPAARPPWYARWPTWAGAAGGLALTAGGLALYSAATSRRLEELHRESDQHQASEALALERRMQTTAVAAQIAGGGAAVAAALAVVFWRREERAAIAPTPLEGAGVGAALEIPF